MKLIGYINRRKRVINDKDFFIDFSEEDNFIQGLNKIIKFLKDSPFLPELVVNYETANNGINVVVLEISRKEFKEHIIITDKSILYFSYRYLCFIRLRKVFHRVYEELSIIELPHERSYC